MSSIARATRRALAVTAMICAVATGAGAHHAAAPVFDLNAEKTVTGVVKQVDWTNPHIWVWVDVPNASGQVETWGFEGMSPNFLSRRGWTRTSLLPGMRISVTFRPLRDGKAGGMFMTGKLEDGNILTSAS
ncbi:MAG TPA: DUF6152 family protein [Vicinamibacterales bacterium]|nr:DUF6152 family protein [Vicinamibacterales bacterium]